MEGKEVHDQPPTTPPASPKAWYKSSIVALSNRQTPLESDWRPNVPRSWPASLLTVVEEDEGAAQASCDALSVGYTRAVEHFVLTPGDEEQIIIQIHHFDSPIDYHNILLMLST